MGLGSSGVYRFREFREFRESRGVGFKGVGGRGAGFKFSV